MEISVYNSRRSVFPRLNLDLGKVKAEVGQKIDSFVEYPGSIKGENGWWRLQEWAEYRIDQSLKKRGERV
jgi:hypothetical protein